MTDHPPSLPALITLDVPSDVTPYITLAIRLSHGFSPQEIWRQILRDGLGVVIDEERGVVDHNPKDLNPTFFTLNVPLDADPDIADAIRRSRGESPQAIWITLLEALGCTTDEQRRIIAAPTIFPTSPKSTPWRCFHCDFTTSDPEAAEIHFGKYQTCEPICTVGTARFRELEDALHVYRTESDAASKTFYELGARHQQALTSAEQTGYDRGLRDGLALSPNITTFDDTGK